MSAGALFGGARFGRRVVRRQRPFMQTTCPFSWGRWRAPRRSLSAARTVQLSPSHGSPEDRLELPGEGVSPLSIETNNESVARTLVIASRRATQYRAKVEHVECTALHVVDGTLRIALKCTFYSLLSRPKKHIRRVYDLFSGIAES